MNTIRDFHQWEVCIYTNTVCCSACGIVAPYTNSLPANLCVSEGKK